MASFAHCINIAQQSGKITKQTANQLIAAQDPEAELENIVATLTRQKRETAIQAVRLSKGWEHASSHEKSAYAGVLALMTKDREGVAGYANIEYRQKYHAARYHAQLADMLQRFRTRKLGFSQDSEGLGKLVRAIYGETVDDPDLMHFAKQWHETNEQMRLDFNAAGGSISKNERYLMPQNHDPRAIEAAGLEKWKDSIRTKLDPAQMLDDSGKPLSPQELENALDYVYETITTRGLNKTKDLTVPRLGKKLARKHSERRFLYFKDAASWMEYQKEFGRGDIFATLTDHVDMMANDIGLMETFGPSPQSTFDALLNQVKKTEKLKGYQERFAKAVYNNVSGKTSEGEMTGLADFMQTTRNLLTASTLGKAFLSAVSDLGFQVVTSKYNSVPAFKVLKRHMQLMTNEEAQVFGVKMGLLAEAMIGRVNAANRYADVYGVGASAKVAEGVMRASLLSPWTDAGRKAFGMEFGSMLAENFGKQFDDLDDNLLRAFKTYGITPEDWDGFRASTPLEFKGAKFADMTQPGGVKFHQMIMSETDFAVPSPDANVRALTNWGLGRASIEGQVWRSAWMLKSFPATIIMTHFYRIANQATLTDKLRYAAALAATTTVLGGVALQMKDIAAGREPRPMDEKFLAASVVQGGGLGLFGDLLFSDVNRFGGGIVQTFTGPTGELIDKTAQLSIGNALQAIKGEETNVLGEAVNYVNRYTPDIWQTHLFTNALFDQLEILSDPDAQKRFNKIARKRRKEYNQDYWWKPGELTPEAMQ